MIKGRPRTYNRGNPHASFSPGPLGVLKRPSNNKQELLTRLTDITQDAIFAKEQQLKIVYYVLLLFAAIIAISHQFSTIYPPLKVVLYILVGIVAVSTTVHQVYNKYVIRRYRAHASSIEILLCSEIKDKIQKMSGKKNPTPRFQSFVSWLYTVIYILLIVSGAGIVGFIINLK